MRVGGQPHAPAALPPGKGSSIPRTGGRVGPRTGVDGCGKSGFTLEFDPRTVQPVESLYTEIWKTCLPEIEPRFVGLPARSLITILTTNSLS